MADPLTYDFPVLLGPVRVETRFLGDDLLVRVFPDEWSIDKLERRYTRAELGALDAYWTAYWRAGGNPVAEQAAWHELVGRIPAGRASWQLTRHAPANPADRPTGVPAGTTVLVIASDAALPADDRQPTITYWSAVWRAHGNRERLRDADIALLASVGAARADAIRARRPVGVDAASTTAATAPGDPVVVAFLVLAPPPAAEIAPESWTQVARARFLPDRFTVLGYAGGRQVFAVPGEPVSAELAVSPDPSSDDKPQVDEKTGQLHVPDALAWMTDFERAHGVGMGIRIGLDPDTKRDGLDRLVVIGLRQVTPERAALDLGELLADQLHSPAGLSLLPQGTPTNNTERAPAGQDAAQQAEAARRTAFTPVAAAAPGDWTAKTDGQWFAELLGLDPEKLAGLPNADLTDRAEAHAAHLALWPATWGNFLQTVLHPILPESTVELTREFFLRNVSGRGPIPTVKIGRQPYGILPTAAFTKLTWPDSPTAGHRRGLHKLLVEAANDWRDATAKVSRVGHRPQDDAHQKLLDILALHPTSAEYHQRYARSVEDMFNRENLGGAGTKVLTTLTGLGMAPPLRALLTRLGYPSPWTEPYHPSDPDLLRRLFTDTQHPLLAPLIDDAPLSETDPLRAYTADKRNYLRWLADNGRSDLDAVRMETGFLGNHPPATLLYLLARHALLLGWADAARRLAVAAQSPNIPSPADPLFVHVKDANRPDTRLSESRYRQLYTPDRRITGDPAKLVHQFIPGVIDTGQATARLAEQIRALGRLAELPTARLERVVAEHLDCATYRLDAWLLGLANERIAELRYGTSGTATPKRGVHVGAYGWLEDVRPGGRPLTEMALPAALAEVHGGTTVPHDTTNGGYIHAPSPSHARTAAVLRAGYVANRSATDPGSFAVRLSSERVRVALALLDGLRQGQPLGALLGYRFERGLHEGHPGVELDSMIPLLRGAFPLRAGKLSAHDQPPSEVKLVEARNVVDGLELVRRATRPPATPEYPFGATGLPPVEKLKPGQAKAMNDEVKHLIDIHDALADLAVAEGTHQALLGNAERASATLDAYAKEGFPPPPAVVETPRRGVTLTHRLALFLRPDLNPGLGTPRSRAEPAVNDWLPTLLPSELRVVALVTWKDPVTNRPEKRVVSQSDIGLAPIDLLWAVRPVGDAERTDLDDRILGYVVERDDPRPDVPLTIEHTTRVADNITFFELSPLITALRALLTTSRPVRTTDLVPAAGTAPVDRAVDQAVSLPKERPVAVRAALVELRDDVDEYRTDLTALYPTTGPKTAEILDGIDAFLTRYAKLITTAGGFGMVRSGWGELTLWRGAVFRDVLKAVAETAARMGRALAEADALLERYDRLPSSTSDEERFQLLEKADRLLTTKPSPRPGTPFELRSKVRSHRTDLDLKLDDLLRVAKTNESTLSGLLTEVTRLLPLTDLDPVGLDLTPFQNRIVTFGRELLTRAEALRAEIKDRLDAADKALVALDAAVTGPDKVTAATDALKALLGEDVLAVPQFTPPEPLGEQWRDAYRDSDELVAHLAPTRDFPVDDWVHGIARVREKPRTWEKTVLLSDALRGPNGLLGNILGWQEPPLTPVQLPYREGDTWLAMEFAPDAAITEDKVLLTAHYATPPLLARDNHCGLLLDEWSEVVPAAQETTGIAVNYDGPDSEPPQAMLLVAPPSVSGTWTQDDLVAAVVETFDLARSRAVEPAHLDDTAWAHLLPATVMSSTRRPITISTDLATANLRWRADHD
ncbi:hypothetical protein [Pseudonocardia acaciae]|uniref:hypothetical protein n=1 Tax=Pseudonocardia acaciae TaxID=551276 RepID=UPI00048AFF9E|nr:hypothetical protein [Pseudonocardia acaciae]